MTNMRNVKLAACLAVYRNREEFEDEAEPGELRVRVAMKSSVAFIEIRVVGGALTSSPKSPHSQSRAARLDMGPTEDFPPCTLSH